jgi:uracil-DNA glycosylase
MEIKQNNCVVNYFDSRIALHKNKVFVLVGNFSNFSNFFKRWSLGFDLI